MLSVWGWGSDELPLEERYWACWSSPSGMSCLCCQLQLFFPYRYFILLRQTDWAQAKECFPRRLPRKQSEHVKLSAPFSGRFGLSEQVWALLAAERSEVALLGRVLVCPSASLLGREGVPTLCVPATRLPRTASSLGLSPVLFSLI